MKHSDPFIQLLTLGEIQNPNKVNYLALGIRIEHTNDLMRTATAPFCELDPEFHAVIHAWYALGQLHGIESVPLLIDLIDKCEWWVDQSLRDEYPNIFASMGPSVVGKLKDYLDDADKSNNARIATIDCLEEMGKVFREECIGVLTDFLSKTDTRGVLAECTVYALVKLQARESLNVISNAFKRLSVDRHGIDLFSIKDFDTVRNLLLLGFEHSNRCSIASI